MGPIVPIGLAAVAALILANRGKASAASPPRQQPPGTTYSTQSPSPPPISLPTPEPPAAAKRTEDMPEQLKQQMAVALGGLGINPLTGKANGLADANAIRFATQLVGQLESQGYYEAAKSLRGYVDVAQKAVPTPAEAKPIAAAAPPQLTEAQKEYIARILSMDRSPAVLLSLINWLKTLPASPERDSTIAMAQALRLQVLEAQSTAETFQKMSEVVKATNEEQLKKAQSPPTPLPAPLPPPVKPQPPAPVPVAAKAPLPLPESPVVVPKAPVPQPLPAQKPPADALAAVAMTEHIKALQSRYGVVGSKGRQNKDLVKSFQRLAGLTADGLPGIKTYYAAASKGAVELPYVMYWPKNATTATVQQYRDMLARLADAIEKTGKPSEARTLRASAARERGQSGVAGTAAAPSTVSQAASQAAAAQASAPSLQPPADSPYAASGVNPHTLAALATLRRGSRGEGVVLLQKALKLAGHSPGSIDGIFGSGTDSAVRAFQRKLGLSVDGIAGRNTLKMLAQNIALVAAA